MWSGSKKPGANRFIIARFRMSSRIWRGNNRVSDSGRAIRGKDLKKLSAEVLPRAVAAIQALAKNPRPAGSRKLAGTENDWRIRVGYYRIVYEISDQIRVVRVNRVRHRRDVYR
jgi:mRNA interferase RelE/StbE